MTFDLHAHSDFSDGLKPAKEVIDILEENCYFTVTDHNIIGIHCYENSCSFTGIEITCVWHNIQIELLCYGYDEHIASSHDIISKLNYKGREELIFNSLIERCREVGLRLPTNISIEEGEWACRTVYNYLIKDKVNKIKCSALRKDSGYFYRYSMNPQSKLFVKESISNYPTVEEVIQFSKDCSGMLFLAHPYAYKFKPSTRRNFISELSSKIDGIECFHSCSNFKQFNSLIEFCKEKNLNISGGSDYHGDWNNGIYNGTPYLKFIPGLNINKNLNWIETLYGLSILNPHIDSMLLDKYCNNVI